MNQQFDNMNTDHDLHAESNTSLQIIHDAQPTLRESIPKAFLNCPATSTRPRHMNLTNHPHSNFQLISITLLIRTEIHSSSKQWRPRSRLDSREPLWPEFHTTRSLKPLEAKIQTRFPTSSKSQITSGSTSFETTSHTETGPSALLPVVYMQCYKCINKI